MNEVLIMEFREAAKVCPWLSPRRWCRLYVNMHCTGSCRSTVLRLFGWCDPRGPNEVWRQ